MRILLTTLLSLPLVLLGLYQVQGMEKMNEDTSMSQPMSSDGMMEHDQMEKTDQMMAPDTMKKDQSMAPQPDYKVPTDAELRQRLTPLQYKVTRKDGTEPAYNNAYWDNHAAGIYVDLISGAPLFSSRDKYESGTGWPSFTKPLEPDNIVKKEDRGFFSVRTEVRGKLSDAHLGHVFDDGPPPTGLRYCMNSAALRFVPAADLVKEGYGAYAKLFK